MQAIKYITGDLCNLEDVEEAVKGRCCFVLWVFDILCYWLNSQHPQINQHFPLTMATSLLRFSFGIANHLSIPLQFTCSIRSPRSLESGRCRLCLAQCSSCWSFPAQALLWKCAWHRKNRNFNHLLLSTFPLMLPTWPFAANRGERAGDQKRFRSLQEARTEWTAFDDVGGNGSTACQRLDHVQLQRQNLRPLWVYGLKNIKQRRTTNLRVQIPDRTNGPGRSQSRVSGVQLHDCSGHSTEMLLVTFESCFCTPSASLVVQFIPSQDDCESPRVSVVGVSKIVYSATPSSRFTCSGDVDGHTEAGPRDIRWDTVTIRGKVDQKSHDLASPKIQHVFFFWPSTNCSTWKPGG